MTDYIQEILKLAKEGFEISVRNNEFHSKDIFYKMIIKSEFELYNSSNLQQKSFAEEQKEDKHYTYEHLGEEKRQKMLLTAYCLSNYEHSSLFPNLTQNDAFIKISDILGVKKSTLKLTRDMFDAHNDNARKGWQADLPESLQVVKDKYDKVSKQEVTKKVKMILGIENV